MMNKRLKEAGYLFLAVVLYFVVKEVFFTADSTSKVIPDNVISSTQSFTDKSIQKELIDFANETNKYCPYLLDKETRLDNVNALENKTIKMNCTLINHIKDSTVVSNLNNKLFSELISNKIKSTPTLKKYRDNDVIWIYTYYDKNGVFITSLTFTPEKYK